MRVWAIVFVVALVLAPPAGARGETADDATPPQAASDDAQVASDRAGDAERTPTIAPRNAADHIGEEVIVEGRVHAVHVSRLATVFAFAPNFAGFTATIHAGDRARFPTTVHETARDRSVRLRGRIRAYRGRAEMTLTDPSQLVVVDAAKPSRNDTPSVSTASADAIQATLARIETRLNGIEQRLATLEHGAGAPTADLAIGMSARAAEAMLGPPLEELDDPTGLRVWVYENGRTVTLDASARVVAWSGF